MSEDTNKDDGRRVPRAKLPVSIMEGPVYWMLIEEGARGVHAFALLCALNIVAHRQGSGTFTEPMAALGRRIGFSTKDIQAAIEIVANACEKCDEPAWVELDEGGRVTLTVYESWNPQQGGRRVGAGRRPSRDSSRNQVAQLDFADTDTEGGEQDSNGNQDGFKLRNLKRFGGAPESESEFQFQREPDEPETRHRITPVRDDPGRGVASGSGSEKARAEGVSDSDSGQQPRGHGRVRWQMAAAPLLGRHGSTRHPSGSPQHNADVTSALRMFDDDIWPEDLAAHEGQRRLHVALDMAADASRNATRPMAYLTQRLKQLDSAVKAAVGGGR